MCFVPTHSTLGVVTVFAAALPSQAASTTIVVDTGGHDNAKAAAFGEARVNWLDADRTDDVACTECFAAVELQRYLRRMTGRDSDFEIRGEPANQKDNVVFVGQMAAKCLPEATQASWRVSSGALAKLAREGYRIKNGVHEGRPVTVVAGGDRVGTLYGVYDLLYRLGCRWFAPEEQHEEVPSRTLDRLPDLDVTETPKFLTRGFHSWENRGNADFLLWMARNRLNYWCVEQEPHALLHKLGIQMSCGAHVAQSLFLNPSAVYPYDHPQFNGDEKRPPDPYPVGEQYRGDANNDGKLSTFEAHPEWYAEVNGERVPGIHGEGGTNYCTSNPHATAEFMKHFVAALVDGPYRGAGVVRFWTLDGGKWCQCAACKALGIPTDRNLLLVHRLSQEIAKARAAGRINRPIIIRFLAYADVLQPPTRPLPADFDYDACSATFFPICRCYVHNFDDPTCSRNARYARHLDGWAVDPKRHYRGQICIGEYYNVSGYKCLPICFMHTMAHDIPTYYKRGARHFHYMHCTTGNWGNKALTNTQMARQLWDPATDCEALWQDYFASRYGAAAAPMRRFYETLEKMLSNVTELKYGLARRLDRGSKDLFPTTHLKYENATFEKDDGPDMVEILAHAKACRQIVEDVRAQALPERVAARAAEDERLFTYGERTLQYYDAAARALVAFRDGKPEVAKAARRELLTIAESLREDTTSTTLASSHANARDALAATYATGAVTILEDLLGPAVPEEVATLDPDKGELVLRGTDFSGGGAIRYGYGFHAYPGRIPVSDDGNYVYGTGTRPHDRITGWFRLAERPAGPIYVTLVGLRCPAPPGGEIAARVLVNGRVVLAKAAPFPERKLGSHEFVVRPEAFTAGINRIQVRNVEPGGHVGQRPWFGIDRVEIRTLPVSQEPDVKPIDTAAPHP